MSDKSSIEWTDATWNPVTGCTKVSEGCRNCYALTFAERWRGIPGHYFKNGFDITLRPDKLDQPLKWKKPRKIFVNSMSDLFHESVPFEFIFAVWARMIGAPQHIYQILTKRPARMLEFFKWNEQQPVRIETYLPNIWVGVSVENQKAADERIPLLLQTPAAIRFLSCEPLLGEVRILNHLMSGKQPAKCGNCGRGHGFTRCPNYGGISKTDKEYGCEEFKRVNFAIDWVIVGGESGHGARPMHPEWARSLRDQCQAAGVSYFFKQWGELVPAGMPHVDNDYRGLRKNERWLNYDGGHGFHGDRVYRMSRVGKAKAGRLLDGREWNEIPVTQ
ncbi:MAG: Phage protein Gp37/Gp68 [Bacilli bacterium]|nr:Phage protein Gp37/Gp68 [Bacilli bacterium]